MCVKTSTTYNALKGVYQDGCDEPDVYSGEGGRGKGGRYVLHMCTKVRVS